VREDARTEQDRHEQGDSEEEHPCLATTGGVRRHAAAKPIAIPTVTSSGLNLQDISTATRR
jgi:hypothetical protein